MKWSAPRCGLDQVEPLPCLGQDRRALGFGQGDVGLVAQAVHGTAVIVVAHPALETCGGAGARVTQARLQRGGVDRQIRDPETCHLSPPTPAG